MLDKMKARFTGWLRNQHDIGRLRHLDNRLLADIGVDRENIPSLVKGDMQL